MTIMTIKDKYKNNNSNTVIIKGTKHPHDWYYRNWNNISNNYVVWNSRYSLYLVW